MKRTTFRIVAAAAVLAAGGGAWLWLGEHSQAGPAATERASATKEKIGFYQCSMHPQVVRDKPGLCPICNMELQYVEETPPPDNEIPANAGESPVPGHASFQLSVERQQLIGVKTTTVERRVLTREIRAVGRMAYDPELYNALAEYREAKAAAARSPERASSMLQSSVLKLRLLGFSDAQIREMGSRETLPINLLLPGNSAWVYAEVFENDAPLIKPGQDAEVTSPSMPGKSFPAKVEAMEPVMNSATRTTRVRLRVSGASSMRPESFVNVTLKASLGNALSVPEDAVLDTGANQIVFVKKGEGSFEPRSVSLGRGTGSAYEVLAGVEAGEEIVTSANFLIDSESRFKSALKHFTGGAAHATGPQR